jgi:hypothetical protein
MCVHIMSTSSKVSRIAELRVADWGNAFSDSQLNRRGPAERLTCKMSRRKITARRSPACISTSQRFTRGTYATARRDGKIESDGRSTEGSTINQISALFRLGEYGVVVFDFVAPPLERNNEVSLAFFRLPR